MLDMTNLPRCVDIVVLHFLRGKHLNIYISIAILANFSIDHCALLFEVFLIVVTLKQILVHRVQLLPALLEARTRRVKGVGHGTVRMLRRRAHRLVWRILQRYPLVVGRDRRLLLSCASIFRAAANVVTGWSTYSDGSSAITKQVALWFLVRSAVHLT